jgi:hypothetical protein
MANNDLSFETQLLQLNTFLIMLGLSDEHLRQQLAQRCLTQLIFVLPEVDDKKATRIVLKQAQQLFNQALADYFKLDLEQDVSQLTALRARLLHQKISTEFLFDSNRFCPPNFTLIKEVATPSGSPLVMPQQAVAFAFGKNSTTIE